jgi:alkylation response protein AidB-like acyl-CoA dehydrogenase
VVQHRAAEAALTIEGARVQALRAVDAMHEMAVAGRQLDDQARVCRVVGSSAKLLRDASDTLMSIGGANAFAEKSPLQRRWRDANIATCHALLLRLIRPWRSTGVLYWAWKEV